ncbi:unnamed protein product, partial [Timema podura]|nr:unnamed protein product [Timema podura]
NTIILTITIITIILTITIITLILTITITSSHLDMERASTERMYYPDNERMDVRLFTSGSSASNPGLFAVIVLLLVTPGKAIYETCSGKTMLIVQLGAKLRMCLVSESGGLTCLDRQIILDTHNKLRQSVAQGGVANQPAAANMMEL